MSNSLGVIVGSGFAALGLEVVARSPMKTPYGLPSAPILTVRVAGRRLACLPRHGEGHGLAPHEINYRANLWALQQCGVRRCIALNTVGAIGAGFVPGDLAIPDQLIDYTHGRASTYGGDGGAVVHIDFTEPFAPVLRAEIAAAVAECGFGMRAGVYGVTQGPRLETAAEIDRLERDGCTMVGMTAMPEAALARELGVDYAVCALAVNYAAGRAPDGASMSAQFAQGFAEGMQRFNAVIERFVLRLGDAV